MRPCGFSDRVVQFMTFARRTVVCPRDSLVRRVVVIGGGISGFAAAHRLLELDPVFAGDVA